ncbi:MAG: alpha/beta hydrolase [Candidatus Hodarchaeales archaeon]|jgi:predicted esterase
MIEENYEQIRQKLQDCFEQKEFEQGLRIALEIKENFPDHASAAYFNLAYFQALLNLVDDTVVTLEEGYEKGLWWDESTIRLFPNFEQLKQDEKFNNIVNDYFTRYRKIREATSFKWVVCTPEKYDSSQNYPALFALHQGTSNIEEAKQTWKSALRHNVLLALPQSSEIVEPNKFTWMDLDGGLNELNEIYSQILAKYQIDINKIFLSGFSIGATLALEATLTRPQFSVKGCIVVNPTFIPPYSIPKNLERAKKEGVKCCILVGTKDPSYEQIKELVALLDREKVENQFYEIPDLGHAIPDNFKELLAEMIDFSLS